MVMALEDWLVVGRIVGAHGLNGELKIYPDSDFPERFLAPGERWLLKPGATQPEPAKLLSGRYVDGKGMYVIKLAGISNRDQSEALRDTQILVRQGDRLPLEPGEFHVDDLIGLAVILQSSQTQIGTITNLFSAGNDLLEVTLTNPPSSDTANAKNPPKVLVPFVEAIVPVVDLKAGRVEITPPKGLLPEE
jgi:16S rRNA processing protein RimM